MVRLSENNPRELMAKHLEALRRYAKKAVQEGDALTVPEERDKVERMGEFLAIGSSLGLKKGELVALLYSELMQPRRGCDCRNCKSRRDTQIG